MFDVRDNAPLSTETLLQRVHPDDRAIAAEALKAESRIYGPNLCEFRVTGVSGEIRWILARSHMLRDDVGRPARVTGIFADVSLRKFAEAEAEQRRSDMVHLTRVATLGELSGAIAHEINQPLSAILLNAEAARLLLRRPNPAVVGALDALDDVARQGLRASQVMERLRALVKRGEMRREAIDINALVLSTLKLVDSELIRQRVRSETVLAPDLPAVQGDPIQLEQVVLNLLMNAMEAMASIPPEDRLVTISTSPASSGGINIRVSDPGTGISDKHLDRVGQPIFTTKERGLGLGLSICSTIVEAHGGKLMVANAPNGGAEAGFTIPPGSAWAPGGNA